MNNRVLIRLAVLLAAVICCSTTLVRGQNMRTTDRGRGGFDQMSEQLGQVGDNPYGQNGAELDENGNPIENGEQADSTKKKKPKKPLESYLFDDSLRSQKMFRWNVDLSANRVKVEQIDTTIYDFNVDYPYLKQDVGDAYLGNLGGASVPINFFRRESATSDRDYTNGYYSYVFTPENAPFYNVKKPYTLLGYITAGQKKYAEESLSVVHAQNISPSTGFNVSYNNRGTKGIYQWQKTKDKNLSIAVSHTGKKYSVHAGYIYNMVYQRENGGLVDDWHVTDTVYETTLNVPFKMKDALNEMRNNVFYVVQALGVPLVKLKDEDFSMAGKPSFYIGHSFMWNRWAKHYTDTYAGTTYDLIDTKTNEIVGQKNYYENWYISPTQSRDTLCQSVMSNKLFVQLQPWDRDAIIGVVDAGIGLDNYRFQQFRLDDYVQGSTLRKEKSIYLYGNAQGKFRKYFDWNADLNYRAIGYRQGDTRVGGNASLSFYIKDKPITLSGDLHFSSTSPSYWSENYFSNHFAWSNSFAKENETRFEVRLSAPDYGAEAALYQSVIGNRVYFDANALPAQAAEAVSVTGVYAKKDFVIGGLHLNNRAMLQWSTNQEVIPVPLAAVNLSYYYQFWVTKDVLNVKIGLDGWWNTRYYAFGYNPATQTFYNQREKQIGQYPMINVFAVGKWKRMRIILQYQHVAEGLFNTREYFNILHYPLNKRIFKFGISWNFYD